jgi:nucleoside phosphorylase
MGTLLTALQKMPILVCFALKEEAAPFHKMAAGRPGIFTAITGIGRANAEKSVRSLLNSCSPETVFTCGFAGGLNPDLKPGDVIFEIGNQQSAIDNQLISAGAKPGTFFCADRIAITIAEKKKLRAETNADAVEMESAAIHEVCRERGIACVTVRAISDPANEDLPLDFNALAKPDQSLDYGKLAWAIARSPGKIGALMKLQKNTSFAARQLAAVLGQVISP